MVCRWTQSQEADDSSMCDELQCKCHSTGRRYSHANILSKRLTTEYSSLLNTAAPAPAAVEPLLSVNGGVALAHRPNDWALVNVSTQPVPTAQHHS